MNPSGKVPTTYAKREEDLLYAGRPERHPGTDEGSGYPTIRYSEGLAMGYRWFQSQDIEPLFPFGFGLSYTTFDLSGFHVDPTTTDGETIVTATVTVTNTGDRAGAEVVQVYLGVPGPNQPPRRLVGFAKVHLEPGESREVGVEVDPAATHHPFSVWDKATEAFIVPKGTHVLYLGTSSVDTPFEATIAID